MGGSHGQKILVTIQVQHMRVSPQDTSSNWNIETVPSDREMGGQDMEGERASEGEKMEEREGGREDLCSYNYNNERVRFQNLVSLATGLVYIVFIFRLIH